MTSDPAGMVAFLTARLDEDEAPAKAAASVAGPVWAWKTEVTIHDEVTDYVTGAQGALLADTLGGTEDMAPHIGRHDPARVLRDVAAKRAIVAEHEITDRTPRGWAGVGYGCFTCHEDDGCIAPRGYCTTLRALATVYSDHPDYRAEWKP